MTHFTLRALGIENAAFKHEKINESCRQAREFDTNSSDGIASISLQERYSMDR